MATAPQPPVPGRIVTIPNVICGLRLIAAPGLIALALAERPDWFLACYIVLAFTDWIDGKLAILLNQRTTFGARLDSVADVTLYACLLIGGAYLARGIVQQEGLWIGTAIASYAASLAAGWWKFGRLPAYHTRAAKTAWLLVLIGAYCVFSHQGVWAIRIAMGAVTLTNIEALLITRALPKWRADVPSYRHALQIARQHKVTTASSQDGH